MLLVVHIWLVRNRWEVKYLLKLGKVYNRSSTRSAFFGDKSAGAFVEVPVTVDTELKAYPTTSFIDAMAEQLDNIFHSADAEGTTHPSSNAFLY